MKLIADLNVNGNQLRDGDKNIGPVVEEITPVNQNEIDLAALRESILEGGKVPVNFTFEDFMTKLFVKVNAEIATKQTKSPKVTVSGALTGTTGNVTVEVGAANSSYSITNTATKTSYTDGQALTHAITNGRVADSSGYKNIGCSDLGSTWTGGDNSTNVKTNTVNMTQFAAGQEASEESKNLSITNISLVESYSASTLDVSTDDTGKPVFRSSYGKALYTAAGQAIAKGSTASVSTNVAKTVTIKTQFYSWVKGTAKLGNVNMTNQAIAPGDVIIYPANKTLSVTWEVLGAINEPADNMRTIETKYIALPSKGTATLLDVAPSDAPYKTYKVYTFTSTLPAEINNAVITIS